MQEDKLITPIDAELAKSIIAQKCPDIEIREFAYIGGGDYSVFEVNNEIVFRFPKVNIDANKKIPGFEDFLFNIIRSKLLPHEIPEKIFTIETNEFNIPGPAIGYRKFSGQQIPKLQAKPDIKLANLLSEFLSRLHSIEVKKLQSIGVRSTDWKSIVLWHKENYKYVKQDIFPLLKKDEKDWLAEVFESFLKKSARMNPPLAFTHGDFDPSNVLIHGTYDHLQVLDFDEVRIYDPAVDFCPWWGEYGSGFIEEMVRTYTLSIGPAFMPRVRFYYNRIPVIYFEIGLKTDNKNFITYGHKLLSKRMQP